MSTNQDDSTRRSLDGLVHDLVSGTGEAREKAASALGDAKHVGAVEPLIAALDAEEMQLRGAAASALGKIGDARAVEPLVAALKNEDGKRVMTLNIINMGWTNSAISNLASSSQKSMHFFVKKSIVDALAILRDQRAVPALTTLASANGEDEKLRAAAVEAVTKTTGKPPNTQGCFIATACYGTADAPVVLELRAFRDEFLVTSAVGARLVSFYCRFSPPLARWIEARPVWRWILRGLLIEPIVSLIRFVGRR